MTKPSTVLLQIRVTPEAKAIWREWANASYRTPGNLATDLAMRWKKGQIILLDEPTLAALMGAADDRIMSKVRRWSTKAVMDELYRQGFNPTPYDK